MTKPTPEQIVTRLYATARGVSANAYTPYSGARVGACALDGEDRVYSGCNVENASYGLTQCAERNALGAAISAGVKPGGIRALLVYATGFDVLAPCGACRQVMYELLAPDALVVACTSEEDFRSWRLDDLLPHPCQLSQTPCEEPQ